MPWRTGRLLLVHQELGDGQLRSTRRGALSLHNLSESVEGHVAAEPRRPDARELLGQPRRVEADRQRAKVALIVEV